MKLADLSADAVAKIKACRYDSILEKHEGPERWESALAHGNLDFLDIGGQSVLLPVNRENHPNITLLRFHVSGDGMSLTLFLKDTTFCDDPAHEMFYAGYMAVCDKIAGEDFYLAVVYHEWFIVENDFSAADAARRGGQED